MNYFSGYRVTSPFGEVRKNPVTKLTETHKGIDLVKADKADISAIVEGKCIFAGETKEGTGLGHFGNAVVIEDKNKHAHLYCHLHSVAVKTGDIVKLGQVIGKQGNTGRSSGSHLHYEVRSKSSPSFGYGFTIDPIAYLDKYFVGIRQTTKTEKPPATKVEKTPKIVKVKKGDTLSKIAQVNKLTVDEIVKLNPQIKNTNLINIGDKIILKK